MARPMISNSSGYQFLTVQEAVLFAMRVHNDLAATQSFGPASAAEKLVQDMQAIVASIAARAVPDEDFADLERAA